MIVLALLLSLLAGIASAQTCKPGEVRVIVHDSQESAVFEAQIRLGSNTTEVGTQITSSRGIAEFENVPCGQWTARASRQGFDDAETAVLIGGGDSVEINIVLNPKMVRSSVEVSDSPPPVEQSSSETTELHPQEVKILPTNPATISDALPLVPGVVRSPDGELKIDGTGEERSALVVNQTGVTDPATGKFGQTVPVDSVETITVLNTPFLAQYGRFTAGVVAVETKRGGEKWHADLNDPFPDFRIRSYHMRGIRNETPRGVVGGPLIQNRLYFITALQYFFEKSPSRTLPFPLNESKQERVNSFTQLDLIVSPSQVVTATFHLSPQHTNFVNPDYFTPQVVAPSFAQHAYIGTLAHHYGIKGGVLDSTISFQRFEAFTGAQGSDDMVLTPEGNRGNYFATQSHEGRRTEWLEIWSAGPVRLKGTHLFKVGSSLTGSSNQGRFTLRPVNILDGAGLLLQRIEFANVPAYNRADLEVSGFVQDHWALNPKIAFDYGARVEHQRLASSLRIAPRAGIAWTPFANEQTVFRAGYGQFYDEIPLDVYTFSRYPPRTITNYSPDGSIIGAPQQFVNAIGDVTGPRSFFVRGQQVAGAFAPRGAKWNVQVEHRFSRLLRVRGVYTDSRSVGLIVLKPELLGTTNELVLNGDGASRYRQLELTARLTWGKEQHFVFTYTRSRSRGDLNEFDNYLGNFSRPVIRPDVYSNLPADLPNRFLVWGHLGFPALKLQVMPIVEYRNGFAYAPLDALQQYVGVPNSDATRFPNFFSADTRIMRDFKVSQKYSVRLSLSCFNLTNHFNALAVHSNVADPRYGIFFGNYHRRYRGDFEVLF